MRERLGRAASRIALLAVLLLAFSLWFFLLRSDPPPAKRTIGPACRKEKIDQLENSSTVIIFRGRGCQEVSEDLARQALGWTSEMQSEGLGYLRLPELARPTTVDLRRKGPEWETFPIAGWPGTAVVRVSPLAEETRFRLESALADLALFEAAPRTAPVQRRLLAEALVLKQPHFRQPEGKFPVPGRALRISRRIDLQSYPEQICRDHRCRLPGL